LNFTVTPGLAWWNCAPIWSNASVSEVAANTTSVPDSFAGELPEPPPAEEVVPEELHAASTTATTPAPATASSPARRRPAVCPPPADRLESSRSLPGRFSLMTPSQSG